MIRITLPPLRSRLEDLPLLAAHLWHALATRTGSKAVLSPATIAALCTYDWPGNVRELQNVLASLLVSAPAAGLVGPSSLPGHVARAAAIRTVSVARSRAPAVRGALRPRGDRARGRPHRGGGARVGGHAAGAGQAHGPARNRESREHVESSCGPLPGSADRADDSGAARRGDAGVLAHPPRPWRSGAGRCSARARRRRMSSDLRARLGLDRPLLEQYGVFLSGLVRGDLGRSFRTSQPVTTHDPRARAGDGGAGAGGDARGDDRGGAAWRHRRGQARHVCRSPAMTLALGGISIPNFWLGPMLAIVFCGAARVGCRSRAAAGWTAWSCPRSRSARRWPRFSPG